MTTSAKITRNPADSTTYESNGASVSYAYAHYDLSQALTSATTVNVSVNGSGGATAADFGVNSVAYQMGAFNPTGTWITTSSNGPITLNAGYTSFNLRVLVAEDSLAETGEGVTFVVSQTASTVGIVDSYWVPAQVDIFDPIGKGASATPRTILVSGTVPGVEGGHSADANYSFGGGSTYSDTEVKLSVTTGLGGASTADYTALYYSLNGGTTHAFNNNDLITIHATDTSLTLSANLLSDGLAESGEQLMFTVSQTANSIGLVNSWAVQNTVDLNDPPNAGVNVHSRTITAGATQTGVEGNVTPAMATFDMTYGAAGGGYASDVVKVGIVPGLGGSSTADYINFKYSFDNSTWTTVDTNGLVTIPGTSGELAHLYLKADVVTDLIAEAAEQLIFTVSQTATGPSLTNSWWVPNTVNIRDADGTGATAISRTIVANGGVTGVEGSRAQANYSLVDVSSAGSGYADVVVKVGVVTGLGGSSTADYQNLEYCVDGSSWHTVDTSGLVTIPGLNGTVSAFSLRADVISDDLSESSEQLLFTVSNTGSSPAITDSWWVPNVVNLQDAPGTGAVAYPRHITEGTPTTGVEGADNWTTNTSPVIAKFNVSYDGPNTTTTNYSATEVHVSAFAAGGATAADYSGLRYRVEGGGATWQTIGSNGLISIPAASSYFELASLALTDQIVEAGEGITFAVSQTANSIGLVDSWWVTSTAGMVDESPVYTVMTGANGADIFTGTSARDKFVIPDGSSLVNGFDTINGFAAHGASLPDIIDLPITATGIVTKSADTPANIISTLGASSAGLFAGAQVAMYPVTGTSGADVFVAIDSNGNGDWDPATDTVIKLTGITNGPLTTVDFG